jgi:hypothetical protein
MGVLKMRASLGKFNLMENYSIKSFFDNDNNMSIDKDYFWHLLIFYHEVENHYLL